MAPMLVFMTNVDLDAVRSPSSLKG